jgi:hypothetical protein
MNKDFNSGHRIRFEFPVKKEEANVKIMHMLRHSNQMPILIFSLGGENVHKTNRLMCFSVHHADQFSMWRCGNNRRA